MDSRAFREEAHKLVDWMADYLEQKEKYPVKSQVKPGEIIGQLPESAPGEAEPFHAVMEDFENIIMPGMTHWQSPNFYAYFPANSSYPSLLAEMLTATLGAQCMIWETSPAAAELEERMMQWLAQLIGIPADWAGVIQDTASTATFVALLTARERASAFRINEEGFAGAEHYRVYCSTQTHSSVEKAVKMAGFGRKNLVFIDVAADTLTMQPQALRAAIQQDKAAGLTPLCAVAAFGTTGTTALDPVGEIAAVCAEEGVWCHIDAAYAGSALILPEYQHLIKGIEQADSFVFNPHKWLMTNFDCTAYYVKDKASLIRTFEILPEYLKTKTQSQVNDYRDWGIQLGRRFRALKLWFVMRSFGVEGMQKVLRGHMNLAAWVQKQIEESQDFELLYPVTLNLVCFRYNPGQMDEEALNALNETLMHQLNASGKLYLTHTKINGVFVLRMVIGNAYVTEQHVQGAWQQIAETARAL